MFFRSEGGYSLEEESSEDGGDWSEGENSREEEEEVSAAEKTSTGFIETSDSRQEEEEEVSAAEKTSTGFIETSEDGAENDSWCEKTLLQKSAEMLHWLQWRLSVGPQKSGWLEQEQKSAAARVGSGVGCLQSMDPLVIRMNQLVGG